MDYGDVISDFADRTRHNLEIVREQKRRGNANAYEVTQLCNSLLGLLVFPRERMLDRIPAKPITELESEGWPSLVATGNFKVPADLNELFRFLRNSIAHFNIEFQADIDRQITGLRMWNTRPRSTKKTCELIVTIEQLEEITSRFVPLLLN